MDTTAPIFNAGYPKIENLATAFASGATAGTATFDITVNVDEPGTAYYVLFEPAPAGSGDPGSVPPSPDQVKACQDYKGNAATFCGNWGVAVADADASIAVPEMTAATPATLRNGLADETHYIVFVVVEDDSDLATGGLWATRASTSSPASPSWNSRPLTAQPRSSPLGTRTLPRRPRTRRPRPPTTAR